MNPKGDTSSEPLIPPPPVPSAERMNEEEGKLEQEEAKPSKRDDGAAAAAAAADDDDDGYLTPTSPMHKIPVPLECPAAPRKPPPTLYLKRKMRSSGQVDTERETGFDHLSRELDEFAPVAKKTKAEAAGAK